TYLWSRARDLIAEHPLLGSGFGAFWRQGNLDAEGLWQFAGITARTGFNFHNTFYESLVGIGWVGTLILGFTFVVGLARLSGDYAERPRLLVCFWLGLAAYFFIRMPTECIGLNAFYFATVLLYATLGASRPAPGPMSLRRGMAQLAFACRSAARTAPAAAVSATARFAAP
ncbi:MAG: O-antigen ligase family protein, partial [Rhizomicrobium sp.]